VIATELPAPRHFTGLGRRVDDARRVRPQRRARGTALDMTDPQTALGAILPGWFRPVFLLAVVLGTVARDDRVQLRVSRSVN
jgi:hypothetical protein